MQKEREKIKKYSIIYADPPWRYSAKKVQGAAENHYPRLASRFADTIDFAYDLGEHKSDDDLRASMTGALDDFFGNRQDCDIF